MRRLAAETPAVIVLFDALAVGDRVLTEEPLSSGARCSSRCSPILATAVPDAGVRRSRGRRAWFHRFEGAGLDGIVAKRLDGPYTPDKRTMIKVKHERTADCAVAGYRIHKDGKGVGSLLLGLYDDEGTLHHVGVAAGFTANDGPSCWPSCSP